MQKLNLPVYEFRYRPENGRQSIFDEIRKKYVALTPEEWVRQNFVRYLCECFRFPKNLVGVEVSLEMNGVLHRADIVAYNRQGVPLLITECKSIDVQISQQVFDQIARYNLSLRVNYLLVTNGLSHYCCKMDYVNQTYRFIDHIPVYDNLQD